MPDTGKKKKLTGAQGELMRVLQITPDDVRANENGYITDNQREVILKQKRVMYMYSRSEIVTAVSFIAFVMLMLVSSFMPEFAADYEVLLVSAGAFSLTMLGIYGLLYWDLRRVRKELMTNQLKEIRGIAVANINSNSRMGKVEINDVTLITTEHVVRRVQHLEPYVAYYLPQSKILLAMEHIDNNDNIRHDKAESAADRSQDTKSTADDDDLPSDNRANDRTQQRTESS